MKKFCHQPKAKGEPRQTQHNAKLQELFTKVGSFKKKNTKKKKRNENGVEPKRKNILKHQVNVKGCIMFGNLVKGQPAGYSRYVCVSVCVCACVRKVSKDATLAINHEYQHMQLPFVVQHKSVFVSVTGVKISS